MVLAAYLGWIAFGAVSITLPAENIGPERSPILDMAALSCLATFWAAFAKQHSPLTFYLYICFPVYFWHQSLLRSQGTIQRYFKNMNHRPVDLVRMLARGLCVVGALEAMAVSPMVVEQQQGSPSTQIGYTYRQVWSAGFIVIGILWPIGFVRREVWSHHTQLVLGWSVACLTTAIFPMLSVDKKEDLGAM